MTDAKVAKKQQCPKCGQIDGQMNAGYNKSGSQRCVCRSCNYKYTLNPLYSEELRQQALQLYYSGMSGRKVGEVLNISKSSVFNWVKKNNEDKTKKIRQNRDYKETFQI